MGSPNRPSFEDRVRCLPDSKLLETMFILLRHERVLAKNLSAFKPLETHLTRSAGGRERLVSEALFRHVNQELPTRIKMASVYGPIHEVKSGDCTDLHPIITEDGLWWCEDGNLFYYKLWFRRERQASTDVIVVTAIDIKKVAEAELEGEKLPWSKRDVTIRVILRLHDILKSEISARKDRLENLRYHQKGIEYLITKPS